VKHPVIAIAHAFSRRNADDGLLLDLTLERIRRAGISLARCRLIALDPESFQEEAGRLESVRHSPGEPWGRLFRRLIAAGGNVLGAVVSLPHPSRLAFSATPRALTDVGAIVGIGGGYLKADRWRASMGLTLNHLPSLLLAARLDVPSVYLPQTVGPLRGPVGNLTRRLVSRVDHVFVRDPESAAEVQTGHVTLAPDLAVLHLADSWPTPPPMLSRSRQARPVIAPRPLPRPAPYEQRLHTLALLRDEPLYAVQSRGLEGRSDKACISRSDARSSGTLSTLPQHHTGGVVVSVRLHGALQALLTGRPAIHLSYDRKGTAAFRALGLDRFVHDAWTFAPGTVQKQVRHLQANPAEQHKTISQRIPDLQRLSREVQRRIDEVLAPVL
jgi:hypothetical protein